MKWCNKITNIRKERSLTQDQLAKILNVSRSQISKFESGDREPDILTIHKIVKHFDITYDYLFNDSYINLEEIRNMQCKFNCNKHKKFPLSEVSQECIKIGINEIVKEIDIRTKFENCINIDFNLEDLNKINFDIITYKDCKTTENKINAIIKQLEIWGVYNEIDIKKYELNLINSHLKFIFSNLKEHTEDL